MRNIVNLLVEDQDMILIDNVLAWIGCSHPEIRASRAEGAVTLASEDASVTRLRHVWRCGLLNERFVRRGFDHRARVLADLVA